MRLAFLMGIPDPDLQRVQSHLLTNLIQLRFHRERSLRRSIAALYCALVDKSLLNGVYGTAGRQALDRGDGAIL